jgi:hypothetical protein
MRLADLHVTRSHRQVLTRGIKHHYQGSGADLLYKSNCVVHAVVREARHKDTAAVTVDGRASEQGWICCSQLRRQ